MLTDRRVYSHTIAISLLSEVKWRMNEFYKYVHRPRGHAADTRDIMHFANQIRDQINELMEILQIQKKQYHSHRQP